MEKLSLFILAFLSLFLTSFCQNMINEDFTITHGPYIQNLNSEGVTIIWSTNKPAVPGVYLSSSNGTRKFIQNSHDGLIDGGDLIHKVRIEGLEPGNTYNYEINSVQILKFQAYRIYYGDTLTGKPISFRTFPLSSENVNFTVINDVHNDSKKLASYLKKGNAPEQDFYFFNGDMVNFFQKRDELFEGFIDTAAAYFAMSRPFFFVRGNHETRGLLARELKNYFDFKDNRYYHSFTYGPVHFIILDSGEDKPDDNKYYYGLADYDAYRLEELEWLKKEIISKEFRNAKYRVVIIHMPIIKQDDQWHGMQFLADNYGPVLHKAGIDLMISGHLHRGPVFLEKGKSGFNYPVLINSHKDFVEVNADSKEIKATVKNMEGEIIQIYSIK